MMINDNHLGTILDIWQERGEKSSCIIIGNSMSPMIRDGDRLIIDHGTGHIYKGDIIVFRANSQYVVHRVVRISISEDGPIFLLKGDGGYTFDQPITREQVVGKVIEILGSNGHIQTCLFSWKITNFILATLSYGSGKCLTSDLPAWKFVHYLFRLQSRIFPKNRSIKQIIIDGVCLFSKLMKLINTTHLNKKR